MVGVPGRSKGCATCRRRKVRCDLQQPFCQTCEKSARQCEGYDRYAVFINRTAGGLEKREHLEEVKPPGPIPAVTPYLNDNEIVSNQEGRALGSGATLTLSPGPSLEAISEAGFISRFWEQYSPSGPLTGMLINPLWLHYAMAIARPTPSLKQALLALAVTRCARIEGNDTVLLEGRRLYTQALHQMRVALADQDLIRCDETLASARIMVLYELFESTDSDPASWHSHVSGLAHLVLSRGPKAYRRPFARALLEEFRYAVFTQSLMLRKCSPFGRKEWLEEPWRGDRKGAEQRLFDIGIAMGGLLEETDRLAASASNDKIRLLTEIVQSCCEFHRSLQGFWEAHLAIIQPQEIKTALSEPLVTSLDVNLEKLNHCHLYLIFWSLRLMLGFIGSGISAKVRKSGAKLPADIAARLITLVDAVDVFANDEKRSEAAYQILEYVPVLLNKGMGQFGASRAILPLSLAIVYFQSSGFERELSQCRHLREQVYARNGLRLMEGITRDGAGTPQILRTPDLSASSTSRYSWTAQESANRSR